MAATEALRDLGRGRTVALSLLWRSQTGKQRGSCGSCLGAVALLLRTHPPIQQGDTATRAATSLQGCNQMQPLCQWTYLECWKASSCCHLGGRDATDGKLPILKAVRLVHAFPSSPPIRSSSLWDCASKDQLGMETKPAGAPRLWVPLKKTQVLFPEVLLSVSLLIASFSIKYQNWDINSYDLRRSSRTSTILKHPKC